MKLFHSKLFALFTVSAIVALLLAACGAALAPVQQVSGPVHSHTEPHEAALNIDESSPHAAAPDSDEALKKDK